MQLADFGLIASALQLYGARHAHAHIPRDHRTPSYVLSSDVGSTPEAVFTRSTTSLYFLEADVDIQYHGVYHDECSTKEYGDPLRETVSRESSANSYRSTLSFPSCTYSRVDWQKRYQFHLGIRQPLFRCSPSYILLHRYPTYQCLLKAIKL